MSMVDTFMDAIRANPKIAIKLMTNAKPLWDAVQSAGFTEEDIVSIMSPGAKHAPVVATVAVQLPQKGYLLDHEGKVHSVEAMGAQMLEQLTAPAQVAPIAQAPKSCLGCRDALNGTDQPSYNKACGDKNCKGNPARPNYSRLG